MDKILNISLALVRASGGNPVTTTGTVMLFYIMLNVLEGQLETLIFGERFEHWLDPTVVILFMGFAAYTVWLCGQYNELKARKEKP